MNFLKHVQEHLATNIVLIRKSPTLITVFSPSLLKYNGAVEKVFSEGIYSPYPKQPSQNPTDPNSVPEMSELRIRSVFNR
jgi:hypothetical protein